MIRVLQIFAIFFGFSAAASANVVDSCSPSVSAIYNSCIERKPEPACRHSAAADFSNCLSATPNENCDEDPREECDAKIPSGPTEQVQKGNGICFDKTQSQQSCRYFDTCGRVSTYVKRDYIISDDYLCSDRTRVCDRDSQCGKTGVNFCTVEGKCDICSWQLIEEITVENEHYFTNDCMCTGHEPIGGDVLKRYFVGNYKNNCTSQMAKGNNFQGTYCSHSRGEQSFRCWSTVGGGGYPLDMQTIPATDFVKDNNR